MVTVRINPRSVQARRAIDTQTIVELFNLCTHSAKVHRRGRDPIRFLTRSSLASRISIPPSICEPTTASSGSSSSTGGYQARQLVRCFRIARRSRRVQTTNAHRPDRFIAFLFRVGNRYVQTDLRATASKTLLGLDSRHVSDFQIRTWQANACRGYENYAAERDNRAELKRHAL